MADNGKLDISEFYPFQVQPGPNSFLTLFDVAIKKKLNELFQDTETTLETFIESSELLKRDVTAGKIAQSCWNRTQDRPTPEAAPAEAATTEAATPDAPTTEAPWDKEILKIPISEFIKEGLFVNGRLFSAAESGNRDCFTKANKKDSAWTPTDSAPLIDNVYLKFSLPGKQNIKGYNLGDLNTLIDGPEYFGLPNPGILFEEKERIKRGFTIVSEDDMTDQYKAVRILGVVIFDIIIALVSIEVMELVGQMDERTGGELAENIRKLFTEFPTWRSNTILERLGDVSTPPIILLQEAEKRNIDSLNLKSGEYDLNKYERNQVSLVLQKNGDTYGAGEALTAPSLSSEDSYEIFGRRLQVGGIDVNFVSFHGDTTGKKTKGVIEKVLQDQELKANPLIIGLDSNLKKAEQLYAFMKMCKSNGAKIAGFNLGEIPTEGEAPNEAFKKFHKNLQKVATNGGIRSACQAQWGKTHSAVKDYIDFIVYRGLEQVKEDGTELALLTLATVNGEPGASRTDAELKPLVKKAGIVDNGVDVWGSTVLSATNPSDHLPRCSTFKIGDGEPFSVMSWNVAGPNFNWAEYYGTDNLEDIKDGIRLTTLESKQGLTDNEISELRKLRGAETAIGGGRTRRRRQSRRQQRRKQSRSQAQRRQSRKQSKRSQAQRRKQSSSQVQRRQSRRQQRSSQVQRQQSRRTQKRRN